MLAVCGLTEGLITGRETGVRLALLGPGGPDETGDMMVVSTGLNDAVPPFGPLGLGDKTVLDIGFITADSGADTWPWIGIGNVSVTTSVPGSSTILGKVGSTRSAETGALAGATFPSDVISGVIGATGTTASGITLC
tara:strand:- start:339 stop:749 length:411 start_codon:yes stop_codon:yes gene_type:complete